MKIAFSTTHLAAGVSKGLLFAVLLMVGLVTSNAVNIAPQGTGIIGLNFAIDSTLGTPFEHAGFAGNVNDGNLTTSVDTFNGGGAETFSYVGVLFPTLRTDFIQSFTLTVAAFFDGGWFGPNNFGPGASGQLTSEYLTEPTLQITTDGGATWLNRAATSNYVSALNGTRLPVAFGPPTRANPATFTLTAPQTGINGIRLIGSEGGTASGGFLGVFEVAVEAIPEPGTALLVFAGVGLLACRRPMRSAGL